MPLTSHGHMPCTVQQALNSRGPWTLKTGFPELPPQISRMSAQWMEPRGSVFSRLQKQNQIWLLGEETPNMGCLYVRTNTYVHTYPNHGFSLSLSLSLSLSRGTLKELKNNAREPEGGSSTARSSSTISPGSAVVLELGNPGSCRKI